MRDGEPWYRVWFDSPYYGILYGDRDQEEADAFIRRLEGTLRAQPPATALDVACGTGRHSVVLAELGYDVLGIDLSAPSIAVAERRTRPNLTFQVLDMRAIEWRERFDLAVNLFTSFGYFGDEDDERRVLGGIERALRPGGELVIDFLNAARTVAEARARRADRARRDRLRHHAGGQGRHHRQDESRSTTPGARRGEPRPRFQERVRALSGDTLHGYLRDAGLSLERRYGDYALRPFRPDHVRSADPGGAQGEALTRCPRSPAPASPPSRCRCSTRGNVLLRDLAAGLETASRFFTIPPRNPATAVTAAARSRPTEVSLPAAVAQALAAHQRRWDGDECSIANAEALTAGRATCIITGQQAGLLGGPVYTAYKIATAVRLAQQAAERTGRRCVPVFWLASEDHDIGEANHTFGTKPDGEIGRVSFRAAGGPRAAPAAVRCRGGAPAWHDTLTICFPQATGGAARAPYAPDGEPTLYRLGRAELDAAVRRHRSGDRRA